MLKYARVNLGLHEGYGRFLNFFTALPSKKYFYFSCVLCETHSALDKAIGVNLVKIFLLLIDQATFRPLLSLD